MSKKQRNYTVAVLTVRENMSRTTEFLRSRGKTEFLAVMERGQLALAHLDDYDRIPIELVSQSIKQAAKLTGEPNLGLLIGQLVHLQLASVLTLDKFPAIPRLAFQLLARYVMIMSEVVTINVEDCENATSLVVRTNSPEVSYHQVEGVFSLMSKFMDKINGPTPIRMCFRHSCPVEDYSVYEKAFGIVPEFNSSTNAVYYPRNSFDKEYGVTKSFDLEAIGKLERRHNKVFPDNKLSERCKFLLEQVLPYGEPGKQKVASMLGMNARTFQRRLKEEETNYTKILTELRMALSQKYLDSGEYSNGELAFLLGYRDPSQFYRSFRNWFDLSPIQYRQQLTN
ncbi:MAG: AraC family transcriptional regulator ligand-binding domain-containing protein [Pseudomonadales bacterium]|nr:AraC family transcriptional regulator ligand-binding domain-containing protein [Pseudomonadales bacterium]